MGVLIIMTDTDDLAALSREIEVRRFRRRKRRERFWRILKKTGLTITVPSEGWCEGGNVK